MTVRHEDTAHGPRIVVPLGGAEYVLGTARAAELRDELNAALATDSPTRLRVWTREELRGLTRQTLELLGAVDEAMSSAVQKHNVGETPTCRSVRLDAAMEVVAAVYAAARAEVAMGGAAEGDVYNGPLPPMALVRFAELERWLRAVPSGGDPAEPPADRSELGEAYELAELDLTALDGNGLYTAGGALQDALTAALRRARDARAIAAELLAEVKRLRALINTPRTDEFFEAVRIEAAHQVERWGAEHDEGKRPEDWISLLVYLLGKAARAHFDGDQPKLEHHVITCAAVALNWWRRMQGISMAMRPGVAENRSAG